MGFYGDDNEFSYPKSIDETYRTLIRIIKGSGKYTIQRQEDISHCLLVRRGRSLFGGGVSSTMVMVGTDRDHEGCSLVSFRPINSFGFGGIVRGNEKVMEDARDIKQLMMSTVK